MRKSPRMNRFPARIVMKLTDTVTVSKKYKGRTVEELCDEDPGHVDFLVDAGYMYLDRWAKLYLAARRRERKHHPAGTCGMLDYGPREIDSFLDLPSRRFYGYENE